jgi:hemin uptake protein HemP
MSDAPAPRETAPPPPREVPSEELLRGERELRIRHHGSCYVLRLTRQDKLILTK